MNKVPSKSVASETDSSAHDPFGLASPPREARMSDIYGVTKHERTKNTGG